MTMMKIAIALIVSLAWTAVAAWVAVELCPLMIVSGQPHLILLAFLVPPAWLIATLFAYIAWAGSSWSRAGPAAELSLDKSHRHHHQRPAHA